MGRAPCCDKANVKKGPWSPEEDSKLKSYIEQHGTGGNWIALPQKIGLKRCGKSCRLRWLNYLRPNLRHGEFSEEEDNIICNMYIAIGSRWSIIAGQLPGRTDNDIKNYWNTRLKKKLFGSKLRKDPNLTTSRRARILKQEALGEEINGTSTGQPNPYNWPEPSFTNESSSMRRLVMTKPGGRFSTEPSFMVPPPPPPPPSLQVYEHDSNSVNMMMELDHNSMISSEGLSGSSGFNNIPAELDVDMFGCSYSCNSVKLEGLDCFFGVGNNNHIVDDQTSGSLFSTNFKSNWSEVSPSITYQSVMPSYQQMQACLFEDTL